jgi:hypothetical protein
VRVSNALGTVRTEVGMNHGWLRARLERMPGEAGFGGAAMGGVCPGQGWIAVDLASVCGRLPWVVTGMP